MITKHTITTLIIICATLTNATAQLTGGIRGGLNLNRYYRTTTEGPDVPRNSLTRPDFHAGIYASIPVFRNLGFSPELLYSRHGMSALSYHEMIGWHTKTLTSGYIELPLLLTYRLYKGVHAEAGPDIALRLPEDIFKPANRSRKSHVDLGINAGLRFPVTGRLLLTIRYRAGTLPAAEYYHHIDRLHTGYRPAGSTKAYNHSWMAGLGFALK